MIRTLFCRSNSFKCHIFTIQSDRSIHHGFRKTHIEENKDTFQLRKNHRTTKLNPRQIDQRHSETKSLDQATRHDQVQSFFWPLYMSRFGKTNSDHLFEEFDAGKR